jgi:hypothetical protein
MAFTFAPRTPLLALMHSAGRLFPRSDRSPSLSPVAHADFAAAHAKPPRVAGLARRAHAARGQWFLHLTSLGVDTLMKLRVPMPRWFTAYGTRFMPFADAASPELPMARCCACRCSRW